MYDFGLGNATIEAGESYERVYKRLKSLKSLKDLICSPILEDEKAMADLKAHLNEFNIGSIDDLSNLFSAGFEEMKTINLKKIGCSLNSINSLDSSIFGLGVITIMHDILESAKSKSKTITQDTYYYLPNGEIKTEKITEQTIIGSGIVVKCSPYGINAKLIKTNRIYTEIQSYENGLDIIDVKYNKKNLSSHFYIDGEDCTVVIHKNRTEELEKSIDIER